MKIKDFGVEMWMNAYENGCTYNLAETCVESLTVEQLLELGGCREQAVADILGMKLTYGAIEGSPRLRMLIAGLYEKQTPENVITAHGAIGANHLVIEALAGPGDEVVSVLPLTSSIILFRRRWALKFTSCPCAAEMYFCPTWTNCAAW